MHLAVQLQRLDDLGAECLQRAAVVVEVDAGRERNHPVRDHRRQPPREEGILAVLPPPAGDVVAAIERRDERRDVARIVLKVAVGGDDHASPRVVEAGGERRRLAEIAPEPDHAQPVVDRLQLPENLKALVGAAIVDHDDFVGASPRPERQGQLGVELQEARRLVANRDDDGQLGIHRSAIGSAISEVTSADSLSMHDKRIIGGSPPGLCSTGDRRPDRRRAAPRWPARRACRSRG